MIIKVDLLIRDHLFICDKETQYEFHQLIPLQKHRMSAKLSLTKRGYLKWTTIVF